MLDATQIELLSADQVDVIRWHLGRALWTDGAATTTAPNGKSNKQARSAQADAILLEAIHRSDEFRNAVLVGNGPIAMSGIIYSRYGEGDSYPLHVDQPLMQARDGSGLIRTDYSVTVLLSGPDEYAGGDLMIGGQSAFSGDPAGQAIVYPTGTLHEVTPITEGERWAAVFWVQSLVRDPMQRQVLRDLKAEDANRQHQGYGNLLRMWVGV